MVYVLEAMGRRKRPRGADAKAAASLLRRTFRPQGWIVLRTGLPSGRSDRDAGTEVAGTGQPEPRIGQARHGLLAAWARRASSTVRLRAVARGRSGRGACFQARAPTAAQAVVGAFRFGRPVVAPDRWAGASRSPCVATASAAPRRVTRFALESLRRVSP